MQFQNRNIKRTLYPERSQNVVLMPELLYMISATTSSRMRDDHQHPSNPNSINPNSILEIETQKPLLIHNARPRQH